MLTRIVNGIEQIISDEEEKEILAEWAANEKEMQANEYLRKRQSEYPSTEEQIKMIREGKVAELNLLIASVDAKYPAPADEVKI